MSNRQRITVITIMAACMVLAATITNASRTASRGQAIEAAKAAQKARVARGAYLVTIGGCNDCHTPLKMGPKGPEPDLSRMLSGHPGHVVMPEAPSPKGPWVWSGAGTNTAFAGPWGVSFARNLTPDQVTGIGIWSEEMFMKTIRSGRHWSVGRPILPPMPWFNYAKMTDEDLKSVYAYLRSIPPVKNDVPDAILAQQ